MKKLLNGKSFIAFMLVFGLMAVGIAGFAAGHGNGDNEAGGILEDRVHSLLAENFEGTSTEEMKTLMDDTYDYVVNGEERPYRDAYLGSLAEELNTEVGELEKTMVSTRIEAINQLEQEGKISSELAEGFRERAEAFPFGYSYGEQKRGQTGNTGRSNYGQGRVGSSKEKGTRTESDTGNGRGYGDGSGKAAEDGSGNGPATRDCDGEGPKDRGAQKKQGRNN